MLSGACLWRQSKGPAIMPAADDQKRLCVFADLIGPADISAAADDHWQMNHHKLLPLWPAKAQKLLEPDAFNRVMRFMLRRSRNGPKAPSEFAGLVEAYRELLPFIDDPDRNDLRRLPALMLFGFDADGELQGGPTTAAADYEVFRAPIQYAARFSDIPGQHAKAANFLAFAPLGPRIAAVLAHLQYNHDRRYAASIDADSYYDSTNLVFWGLMLTVLMTPSAGSVLRGMLDEGLKLPRRAEQLALLARTTAAARSLVPSSDPEFQLPADRLAALR
jgi:hypothetical protein